MKGKIVLEEHVSSELNNSVWDSSGEAARNGQAYMDDVEWRLLDSDRRVEEMDENAIDISIVSLTSPGAQGLLDTKNLSILPGKPMTTFASALWTSIPRV